MRVRTPFGSGQLGYRMTRRRHDFGFPHGRGTPMRTLAICVLAALAALACVLFPPAAKAAPPAAEGSPRYGLVVQDQAALRSAARSGGAPLALLGQGALLELRGDRLDYLQVWDPQRERGGFVRAGFVHPLSLQAAEAPELLALVRFLRDRPGSEALGLGFAAAYLKAAPAGTLTAEAFDAMGTMAERLAWRANAANAATAVSTVMAPGEASIASQLEVATGLGIRFDSVEREHGVALCYDGDAFRHVLALAPTPEQVARAALALTRHECIAAMTPPLQRWQLDQARAALLARVPVTGLPAYLRNRVRLRQAGVWSAIAFEDSRRVVVEPGLAAAATGLPGVSANDVMLAGNQALEALAAVDRAELADDDQSAYTEAAMRIGASRWAAEPAPVVGTGLAVLTQAGQPGETCVLLVDAKHAAANPLARRCTYATVWTASARANATSTALALAVQPLATWRELWMFRATPAGWTVQVLPPATETAGVGYVEFAGWVPGSTDVLAAREIRDPAHGNRFIRTYEQLDGQTLATLRAADAPGSLKAFYRGQDPAWKRITVSLR